MPWKETCAMQEKFKMMTAYQNREFTMAELCRRFGVSRKTAYKWWERFQQGGGHPSSLATRSHANHAHPNAIPDEVVKVLLQAKRDHLHWGPKKIRQWLCNHHAHDEWPAVSTIGDLYQRHGLCKSRQGRKQRVPRNAPLGHCLAVNDVWTADYKGQFRLPGSAAWCYALTVMDAYSRHLLACVGLYHPTEKATWQGFERVFRTYGLPRAIRTDNGTPFASTALGGLTRMTVWFTKLDIRLERIELGHPEQNGRHERMHRTLKDETATPPQATMKKQQREFDRFRQEYNEERPHEALDGKTPSEVYQMSPRVYPSRLPTVEYESGYEVRQVRHNGEIKWHGQRVYVSEALRGEPVGLLLMDDDRWQVYFAHLLLGVLDERQESGRSIRIERPDWG